MRKALVLTLCLAAMLLGCQKKPQVKSDSIGPVGAGAPATMAGAKPLPPRIEPVGPPMPADPAGTVPAFTPVTPMPMARPLPPVPEARPLPPVTVTPPAPAGRTYVIKNRDTLWGIATRELGSGKRSKEIVDLNPGLQPTKLKIGQTLILPDR